MRSELSPPSYMSSLFYCSLQHLWLQTRRVLVCFVGASIPLKELGEVRKIARKVVLGAQLLCWTGQFIGHRVFEKRSPALLDNLSVALLMAPFFVLLETIYIRNWAIKKKPQTPGRAALYFDSSGNHPDKQLQMDLLPRNTETSLLLRARTEVAQETPLLLRTCAQTAGDASPPLTGLQQVMLRRTDERRRGSLAVKNDEP
ncbi:hypothetical protein KSP39_PZI015110 [Platanthera zijinensis]|uniref:Uncharacterized protein n=1 Tax=Platanthera zijinensis TaxID=2320716 RepID=A0AAP0G2K6_9ASPA